MSKPSSFKYPQTLIKQGEKTLSKKLHRIIGQVQSGDLNKAEGREQGHKILEEQYREQVALFNEVVRKKKIIGVTGFETKLYEALTEAKASWGKIIFDIT